MFLRRLVVGVELTIVADVSVFVSLPLLIAVLRICPFKVINDALLDCRLHPGLFFLNCRHKWKFETYFALHGASGLGIQEPLALLLDQELKRNIVWSIHDDL